MKNKGIIINGEWLGERVLTDGLFHAICNISPTIMQEFIKIINKIDNTDNIVKISKFEFPDRNSIDIEFNGEELSGLASLYFKLNEGKPELVNRKVVIYNLENESREVLNETLQNSQISNEDSDLIRVDEDFIEKKLNRGSKSTKRERRINSQQEVSEQDYITNDIIENNISDINIRTEGNSTNGAVNGKRSVRNETYTEEISGNTMQNEYESISGINNPEQINNSGIIDDDNNYATGDGNFNDSDSEEYVYGNNSAINSNNSESGIAETINTSNSGGNGGNLASQIADELCKKIPSLSVPPIQVNLQTPTGSTPLPVQQGGAPQPMPGQPRGNFGGGNPHPQQRPTINDFSAQGRDGGIGGQRGGFGRNSNADFGRKERPKFPPKEMLQKQDAAKENSAEKEEVKEENKPLDSSATEENKKPETENAVNTQGNGSEQQSEASSDDNSKTDEALMEMHDELMLLKEELSAIRALKDPKLMTIEEFLEQQKETKPDTFGTKFRIMGSSGSSVNANLLDDGFFVAGDKIYRWGDTLYLDK